jgi:hypothetical protein
MSFIRRLLNSLFLAALLTSLSGCAGDGTPESQSTGGNIPWNRPEKWEGGGAMGSMMSGSR